MPITHSPKETQLYAEKIAEKIIRKNLTPNIKHPTACIIGLVGDLGSGKTSFIQGFAKTLGIKRSLPSPTFLIVRSYPIPPKSLTPCYLLLVHIDAYRLHRPKEILDLGFQKIINNPHNIVLIEWAEKIKKLLPPNTVWLKFHHGKKENERIINIS